MAEKEEKKVERAPKVDVQKWINRTLQGINKMTDEEKARELAGRVMRAKRGK